MPTPLIHAATKAAELLLKTADASHTSAAALIFLSQVNASEHLEVALGVLALLGFMLLIWDAVRFIRRTSGAIMRLVTRQMAKKSVTIQEQK